jgi:hypothetical protein
MPSAAKTASKALPNLESRSRSTNVRVETRSARSISKLRAAWVVHAPVGCTHPEQMRSAAAMLDGDQDVDPPEQDGVHGHDGSGFSGLRDSGHVGRSRGLGLASRRRRGAAVDKIVDHFSSKPQQASSHPISAAAMADLHILGRRPAREETEPVEQPDRDQIQQSKQHGPRSSHDQQRDRNTRSSPVLHVLARHRSSPLVSSVRQ